MAAARLLTVTVGGTVSQSTPLLLELPARFDLLDRRALSTGGLGERGRPRARAACSISGGAPTVSGTCNDCDEGSDFRCATKQASLFTAPSTMSPAREPLQVARYGHTSTLMRDGNVLIVGGITAAAGNPRVLRDVEVYNPRPIVPVFDSSSGMPDPDDPLASDLTSTVRAPGEPLSAAGQCGEL